MLIKKTQPKECNICYYWCFLDKGFKFQQDVCNGCHDLLRMSMNLSNIDILNIKLRSITVLSTELVKMKP